MKKILFTCGCFAFAGFLTAQSLVPYEVPDSPFKIYTFGTPETEISYSEDSSRVWTTESNYDSSTYSFIGVELSEPIESETEQLELLQAYMDFLVATFEITNTAGYGLGHTLEREPGFQGVRDFWIDAAGVEYSVMGWVNNRYVVVFLVSKSGELPDYERSEIFLKSLHILSN